MTIRHLEIFIEVVNCGKMSLAAKKLYVSQPTVSQAILDLESFYNVKLFERLSKKLYITPEGELMLGYARQIIGLIGKMESALVKPGLAGLKIGATVTIGTCILSGLLRDFSAGFPLIETEILVDNTHSIQENILSNGLDVGLVEGHVQNADIVCEPVIDDRLVLVCGMGHPLAHSGSVTLEAIRDEAFVLREKGSGTRETFERLMQENGYSIRCKWVCNNSEAIKNAVIANDGLSVISYRLVEKEVRGGVLHKISIKGYPLNRKFCLIYHKNKFLSDYLQHFIGVCQEYGKTHQTDGYVDG